MPAWSNISLPSRDPEIIRIDAFGFRLGKLPDQAHRIRELISRHEVCHFKYRTHIRKIKAAITTLEALVVPGDIGKSHIRKGIDAWQGDSTGKSLLGQQYVSALNSWLDNTPPHGNPKMDDPHLRQKVQLSLGDPDTHKVRLVQLLLARLTWDWKLLKELQQGGMWMELEMQLIRMDICHYAFPAHLDHMIAGIGRLQALEKFEGCGSFSPGIRKNAEIEMAALNQNLRSYLSGKPSKENQIKAWLTACLMKTLKEQAGLYAPSISLE